MKNYLKDREIQENLKRIESYKNAVDNPLYDLNQVQSFKVQILIDDSMNHGEFIPDKEKENVWYATKQTFRAMKKDIFALDEQDLDLQELVECKSCNSALDKQFWHYCPYCGSSY